MKERRTFGAGIHRHCIHWCRYLIVLFAIGLDGNRLRNKIQRWSSDSFVAELTRYQAEEREGRYLVQFDSNSNASCTPKKCSRHA